MMLQHSKCLHGSHSFNFHLILPFFVFFFFFSIIMARRAEIMFLYILEFVKNLLSQKP